MTDNEKEINPEDTESSKIFEPLSDIDETTNFTYPKARHDLWEKLLNGYTHPINNGIAFQNTYKLSSSKLWSICHYMA